MAVCQSIEIGREYEVNKQLIDGRVLNEVDMQQRQAKEEYANWVLSIGNGDAENIEIPDDMLCTEEELIRKVFPDLEAIDGNSAILCPKNAECHRINDKILNALSGEFLTFKSADSLIEEEQGILYTTEHLNTIELSGLPR